MEAGHSGWDVLGVWVGMWNSWFPSMSQEYLQLGNHILEGQSREGIPTPLVCSNPSVRMGKRPGEIQTCLLREPVAEQQGVVSQ